MKSSDLEGAIFEAILNFDKIHTSKIFRSSVFKGLIETIRDFIYDLEEDSDKEDRTSFAVNFIQYYLNLLRDKDRITEEAYTEAWNMTTQIMFMYLGKTNVVADLETTIIRFLIYIDSNYQGQDPRTTCAPEEMLKMFEYCIKILRFLGDKSTETILKERLSLFAFQDTLESANAGTRNATKYNHTVELLKRIGSPSEYLLLDENHDKGVPHATNEFGDLVPLQDTLSDNENIEEC